MGLQLLLLAATLGSAAAASSGQFSTTLHGAPTELIEPGTPGATTLQLQPWLTLYDANVRPWAASVRCSFAGGLHPPFPHSAHSSASFAD